MNILIGLNSSLLGGKVFRQDTPQYVLVGCRGPVVKKESGQFEFLGETSEVSAINCCFNNKGFCSPPKEYEIEVAEEASGEMYEVDLGESPLLCGKER